MDINRYLSHSKFTVRFLAWFVLLFSILTGIVIGAGLLILVGSALFTLVPSYLHPILIAVIVVAVLALGLALAITESEDPGGLI